MRVSLSITVPIAFRKPAPPAARTTWAARVVAAAFGVSVVALVAFVVRFASWVPYLDEFTNTPYLFGEATLADYWHPHNHQHRIPLPRLVYVAAVRLAGDFRAPIVLNALLMVATAAGLLLAVRRARGRFAAADAFLPLVLLGIAHWENLLWGFQLQFTLSTACACAFVGLAAAPGWSRSPARLAACGAAAVLAPLCGANGVPYGGTFGGVLLLVAVPNFLNRRWAAGLTALGGGLTGVSVVLAYLVGLERQVVATPEWGAVAVAFVNLLGTGFGPAAYLAHGHAHDGLHAGGVAGAVVVALTAALLAAALVREKRERDGVLALAAFLAATAALALAVAYGRAGFLRGVYAPRYVTLFTPGLVAAYFAWAVYGGRARGWVPAAFALAALAAAVPNAWFTLGVARFHSDRLKRVEHEIRSGLPVGIVADRNPWLTPDPYPWPVPGQDGRRSWLDTLRRLGPRHFRTLAPDPEYVSEPVRVRVTATDGVETVGENYRVTGDRGGVVYALPRRGYVHAVRVRYAVATTHGAGPRTVVSWEPGGTIPPRPGYAVLDVLDVDRGRAPAAVLLVEKETDVLRLDVFEPGTTFRVVGLELLRKRD